ncbi:C3a anaphylatoxin chemotactic receptor-like [Carassius auratus]|uniref:C3a anaphylatoxin chemotactic receptor-like n=1 Tax=Carassius auratus TaxID=7957 RepID=A0A6P6N9E2_CARAU|nr:C3a anaphylatoxin chemotactic receptor-like [Carassius auratus]
MENTSFGAENMTGGAMQQEGFTSFKIFVLCIFFATFVVGLIGNGLVIFLTGCRMKTTVNSIWFLNLAIADFLFMLSSIIDHLSNLGQLSLNFMSYIVKILLTLNLYASIFFLVVISLDRCLCTWMVVWALNKRTTVKAKIICIIVWVSSIGCSFPSFEVFRFTFTFLTTYDFTVAFLIPFLIIASSYTAIGVRLKRLKRGKQLRTYRVIITVTLAFFICWFLYHAINFYIITAVENNWSASHIQVLETAATVSTYLVYLNSCLNPILYVFMCDEYKKKLKQSLLLVQETAFAQSSFVFTEAEIEDEVDMRVSDERESEECDEGSQEQEDRAEEEREENERLRDTGEGLSEDPGLWPTTLTDKHRKTIVQMLASEGGAKPGIGNITPKDMEGKPFPTYLQYAKSANGPPVQNDGQF